MIYSWKGLKDNVFTEGKTDANSKDDAIFLLKQDGIIVTTIDDDVKKKETKSAKRNKSGLKISDKELLLFTKKLTTMMQAGLAIVPALEMLKIQTENPSFMPIIDDLLVQINKYFDSYLIWLSSIINHSRSNANDTFNLIETNQFSTVSNSVNQITKRLSLKPKINYKGGKRGWPGDVPTIYLNTRKIRKLGWRPKNTINESIVETLEFLIKNKWLLKNK